MAKTWLDADMIRALSCAIRPLIKRVAPIGNYCGRLRPASQCGRIAPAGQQVFFLRPEK
jgi:hypothetical protein